MFFCIRIRWLLLILAFPHRAPNHLLYNAVLQRMHISFRLRAQLISFGSILSTFYEPHRFSNDHESTGTYEFMFLYMLLLSYFWTKIFILSLMLIILIILRICIIDIRYLKNKNH